jgi:hypothetical protein
LKVRGQREQRANGEQAGLVGRLRRGGRDYAAAVLLNLALVNAVLTSPPRQPIAQVRVLPSRGPFRETELLRDDDGEPVGVLAKPLDPARSGATASLN